MSGIGQRIRERAKQLDGLSAAEVARRANVGERAFNNYINDEREPDFATLLRICSVLETTPDYLFKLTDVPGGGRHSEFAYIKVLDAQAAAGAGAFNEIDQVKHRVAFRREWLRAVTNTSEDKLAVIEARGDSMLPTINDGDHMLVDLTQTRVSGDGIFIFKIDTGTVVKRVWIDPHRALAHFTSDNPHATQMQPVKLKDLKVMGRVIWIGRRV